MDLAQKLFESSCDSFYSFSEDEIYKNLCEMNALCEEIWHSCNNSYYKHNALNYMSYVAERTHNIGKVKEFISNLPEMFKSFEPLMIRVSKGEQKEWLIDNYIRAMDVEICDMLLAKSGSQDNVTIISNYLKSYAVHEALSDIYVFDLIREGQITDWWELFIQAEEWDMISKTLNTSIEKASKIAEMKLPDKDSYIYSLLLNHMHILIEWCEDKLAHAECYNSIINTIKQGEALIKSKIPDFVCAEL